MPGCLSPGVFFLGEVLVLLVVWSRLSWLALLRGDEGLMRLELPTKPRRHPEETPQRRSTPDDRKIRRTFTQSNLRRGRQTSGGRPTDARCVTTAGKLTMCTADAHTDDSGCADSTQTTRAPGMVNALGRSTSTCDDLSPPSLRPAESSGRLRHDVQLRRCTDPDVKACRPSLSPGKLGAATPGGGVAEDDRRKEPPRTTERSHSPDATHHNDAPASVSNNLNVVIDGHDASALVDTGADYSVLSGRLSRRLRKVMTPWDGPQIRTAGGHLITPVGRCTARVEIHGETCPVKFVVLQDCSRDVILGMDFLCEYGAVIDLGANRLTLRKPASPRRNPKRRHPRSESSQAT
ncbi:hypothetical protein ISCGN_026076 [Ixodes scapularis]